MSKNFFQLCVLFSLIIITITLLSTKAEAENKQPITKVTITEPPIEVKEPEVVIVEPEVINEPELTSLGEFKLTAYCSCSKCCGEWADNRPVDNNGKEIVYGSLGVPLKANYSIAVDPNVIPYNTTVMIDGKIYKAEDCGGAINDNRIDVYFNSHEDALEFGVQYKEVFIYED